MCHMISYNYLLYIPTPDSAPLNQYVHVYTLLKVAYDKKRSYGSETVILSQHKHIRIG